MRIFSVAAFRCLQIKKVQLLEHFATVSNLVDCQKNILQSTFYVEMMLQVNTVLTSIRFVIRRRRMNC